MRPTDLLIYVAAVLERFGIEYAVVGSMASSFYGESRLTNDVDIVAAFPPQRLREFIDSFPKDSFYVSEDAARQAITGGGQFNIIHPESGLKADIIIATSSAFDEARMRRRVRVTPQDVQSPLHFASPEDVILKKMEFYREGGSDKHLRDIAGMLKIRGEQIDRNYIADWAQKLGVSDIWALIRSRLNLAQ